GGAARAPARPDLLRVGDSPRRTPARRVGGQTFLPASSRRQNSLTVTHYGGRGSGLVSIVGPRVYAKPWGDARTWAGGETRGGLVEERRLPHPLQGAPGEAPEGPQGFT